jgi:hypothetical protein
MVGKIKYQNLLFIYGIRFAFYIMEFQEGGYMKKVFIFLTVILLIFLQGIFTLAQTGDAFISGRMTDEKTGEPLVKAFLMADNLEGRNLVARTDSSGFYQLDKLSEGRYELSAFAFGYYLKIYPETLEVSVGDTIVGVDFKLYTMPTGSISGRVTDSLTGVPIAFTRIFVHNMDGCEKALAFSDSLGYYTINKLQVGFYRATAFAKGYKPLKYSTPIEVKTDSITSEINFQMKKNGNQREGKIFGQVKEEESGLGLPLAIIIAYSVSPYPDYEQIAITDEDGKYVLEDLPIMSFKVLGTCSGYISEYYKEALLEENAFDVTPTSSNIDFTLSKTQEGFLNLGGRITSEGEPLRNASVYAYSEAGEIAASSISDSAGEYIIDELLPGNYLLLTTSPDGDKSGPEVKLKFKSFCGVDINIGRSDVGEDKNGLPEKVSLSQNYPNPFNPSTTIPFKVHGSQFIVNSPISATLIIYNLTGQKVRTLVEDKMMPGNYQVIWNGKDNKGNKVSSGAYFYRFKAGENFETKKMIMLK